MLLIQNQVVVLRRQRNRLIARENFVAAMLVVPLGGRCRHMHFFDDVAPAHTRVIRAERNLALLRGIGDNALLRAPEIVVEQVLEPHSSNKKEVPAISAPLLDVIQCPVLLPCRSRLASPFCSSRSTCRIWRSDLSIGSVSEL